MVEMCDTERNVILRNGLFGIKSDGSGFIAAVFEDAGEISRFEYVASTYEEYFEDANE